MIVGFIDTVHPILQTMLEAKGVSCIPLYNTDNESIKEEISACDGLVIRSRVKLDADFLQHAPRLKFIARSGAGMENIDLAYCKQKNIVCFNSPEGNRDAVGEQAIGMLLGLFNRLNSVDAEVRKGIWLREENRGVELAGKTVGIIGYGMMGSAFAKKLSGFDCTVLAFDKYKKNFSDAYVKEVTMDTIFSACDVISLHVPLTLETTCMVDAHFISKMHKPFYLINTARGKCVHTGNLVDGLKQKKIIGACLDVLEYEKTSFEKIDVAQLPEPFQYLIQTRTVLLSPHIAGWTHESYMKLSTYLGEKIIAHFRL